MSYNRNGLSYYRRESQYYCRGKANTNKPCYVVTLGKLGKLVAWLSSLTLVKFTDLGYGY